MNKSELVRNAIGKKQLADYLTADHGEWLGVYANGSVRVGESVGSEVDPEDRPVAMVRGWGIEHDDEVWWRWKVGAENTDLNLKEIIIRGCEDKNVNLDEFIEDLIKRLLKSMA